MKKSKKTIYKCEKCGYESWKTHLFIFEEEEFRFCLKCTKDFLKKNLPKAKLIKEST